MTVEERRSYQSRAYAEAVRYMNNAEETLKRAGRDKSHYYVDQKYVRTACGTAYNGVLVALDAWLTLKGVEVPRSCRKGNKPNKKNINFYFDQLAKLDGKMLTCLQCAYVTLHLSGYYDGVTNVKTIAGGFGDAYDIINKLKPAA